MNITPRPYQTLAANAAVKALRASMKALVVLATGLGKTLTAALIAKRIGGKGIFLVHNNDILEGAMKEFRKVFPNATFGLYNGHSKKIEGADIVFASFQTMAKNLKRFRRNQFTWMIVDESHHSHAETFRRVIEKFDCMKLGITATPDRMDLQDIRHFFGEEVINIQLEEAIARGWLPRIEYHVITDVSMDDAKLQEIAKEVKAGNRKLTIAEIDRRVFIRARDKKIAEIVSGYEEKTVVFCRNVNHAEHFSKSLPSSRTFHSKNGRGNNTKALEGLRNGLIRRVIAVNAFNEGIDVPDVGLVVFARSTESENIFRQQLGRGLRPGKEKLIVLDFVGNIERMRMIRRMMERISSIHEESTTDRDRDNEGYRKEALMLTGKGFEFTFSQEVVDLFEVLDRVDVDYYPTWREASVAALALLIKNGHEYKHRKRYAEDRRLPSDPNQHYEDFPGWAVFLGGENRKYYPNWQKASKAAIGLGIKNQRQYQTLGGRKKDLLLPLNPQIVYEDFPGWPQFFGNKPKEIYSTWQKSQKAALALGIKNSSAYLRRYKEDPQLHCKPHKYYSDFPGWPQFFGNKPKEIYSTWQKSRKAALALGIKNSSAYLRRYKEDPQLHCSPHKYYPDFPGWPAFLGDGAKYVTWQEASKAAKALGIKSSSEYRKRHGEDGRLKANVKAYPGFPGWEKFLAR